MCHGPYFIYTFNFCFLFVIYFFLNVVNFTIYLSFCWGKVFSLIIHGNNIGIFSCCQPTPTGTWGNHSHYTNSFHKWKHLNEFSPFSQFYPIQNWQRIKIFSHQRQQKIEINIEMLLLLLVFGVFYIITCGNKIQVKKRIYFNKY